jgi:hypothetical protein
MEFLDTYKAEVVAEAIATDVNEAADADLICRPHLVESGDELSAERSEVYNVVTE